MPDEEREDAPTLEELQALATEKRVELTEAISQAYQAGVL